MGTLANLNTKASSPEKVLWDQVYEVARKRGLSKRLSRQAADASVIRGKNIVRRLRAESTSNNAAE